MGTELVAPDDPNRCQQLAGSIQCRYRAMPGSVSCEKHRIAGEIPGRYEVTQYKITNARHRNRVNEMKTSDGIKSLRDEIALTRFLIEERFNNVKDDLELYAAIPILNTLMLTMERLVKTTHGVEKEMDVLISRPAIAKFAQQVVQILTEELEGIPDFESKIDSICGRLGSALDKVTNEEER